MKKRSLVPGLNFANECSPPEKAGMCVFSSGLIIGNIFDTGKQGLRQYEGWDSGA